MFLLRLNTSDSGIMTNCCEDKDAGEIQQGKEIVPDRGPTIKCNEHENSVESEMMMVGCCKTRRLLRGEEKNTVKVLTRERSFV